MTRFVLFRVLLYALVSLEVAVAFAQAPAGSPATAPDASPASAAQVVPPALLAFVDAGYPEAARQQKREASVVMRLLIGTDGFVESAELAGPPVGDGFDELALSAARRFLFSPATKNGEPMRARITYRYEFRFQEPADSTTAAKPPSAPKEGELEVTVVREDGSGAVVRAEILVTRPGDDAFALRLESDALGKAKALALQPSTYEVRIQGEGLVPQTQTETVESGQVTSVTYRLAASTEDASWSFGAVARVKAPPREVTRRTIEREELTRVAGTRGDALRTIELLPGVSRPPFGAGLVLIRGSAPGDSQVFLEGMPVPLLYHFGGLTSFINSRALERIDFYPGNFSARYGRQIGGIIDVEVREPRKDGYHGVIDINLPLDSSVLVEGPLGKKATFMVGARRSYFGELAKAFIPDGTFSAFAAPVYYDYQAFSTLRPTDRDVLKFGAYGSSDRLEVLFAKVPDSDPSVRSIEFGLSFHRQQIGWDHRFSADLNQRVTLGVGQLFQKVAVGPKVDFDLAVNNIYLRGEWRYRISDTVQVITGTDTFFDAFDVKYSGPLPTQQEGAANMNQSLEQLPTTSVRDRRTRLLPAAYVELSLRPLSALQVVPGLRVDYFEDNASFAFNPRLSTFYSVTEPLRIKAGVGVFSQAPEPQESSPLLGNKNLRPIRSVHYSVGADYNFTDALSLGVEGFYKRISDRVVSGKGFGAPPFINDGTGRIIGLEVSGRAKPKGRLFGFLSYTLMRSERNDRGEGYRLFDFDQTHILTASTGLRLGKGWETGGTLRYVTGNPSTAVVGASFDGDSGLYTPQNGPVNGQRNPAFNRLDLRVEKTWTVDALRIAAYLDVQNVYNAPNREGTQYSYNYSESGPIRGLVIIPIIGVRGEL